MRVLVACERSGRVRDAFTKKGHDAWSCDLCLSDTKGNHYRGPVEDILNKSWDMIIAFPPCTYLASSGARWWTGKQQQQKEAIEFFMKIVNAPSPKIAVENPIGIMSTVYRKPDQIIQPWMFGHGETKATCLWLQGLPLLNPTNIVDGRKPRVHYESPGPDRSYRRSITYQGIADAMAEQWGSL